MDAEDLKDDVPDKWASSLSDEVLLQALEDTNYPQICDISSVAVGVFCTVPRPASMMPDSPAVPGNQGLSTGSAEA